MQATPNYYEVPDSQPKNYSTPGDEKLHIQFYSRPQYHEARSKQEGRPIFVDAVAVKIFCPGDRNNVYDNFATEIDFTRFRRQYEAFLSNKEQVADGTPLEYWHHLQPSQVAELKALHVHTVEQLAAMSDQQAMKIMGNHDLRAKAQAYVNISNAAVSTKEQEKALAERDEKIAYLQQQVEQLIASQANAREVQKPASKRGS